MPQFSYKAKSGPRDVISGFIEADTIAEAVSKLTDAGNIPVEVKPYEKLKTVLPANDKNARSDSKVSQAALYQFTRQLADLLEAGIPLARCMELLSRQRQFPLMVEIIESMTELLQQGGSLSLALSKYPKIFSPMYI